MGRITAYASRTGYTRAMTGSGMMAPRPWAHAVRASFWRGGTSRGVFLSLADLPVWCQRIIGAGTPVDHVDFRRLETFFATIMGSPDPYGRQLNGMGGGISSLSKTMVVGPSTHPDADVDYTFFQIGVRDGQLDVAGNCGNLSAAVGPFALNAGLYAPKGRPTPSTTLRMRNVNTAKMIQSTFAYQERDGVWQFEDQGPGSIDGVPGTGSPITLSFLDPAGAKTAAALPTGNAVDRVDLGDRQIRASLIDVSNPGVFIDGRDVGWARGRPPEQMNADAGLLDTLEAIRRRGTAMMGLDPTVRSVPKIVLLFPTADNGLDIACQALSMEQAHKAVPVTLALNLGVACKIPGTLPHRLSRHLHPSTTVVGHPSGRLEVGASMRDGKIQSANLVRTARCHMDGYINLSGGNLHDPA